jgi:hypothetical protein
VYLDTSIPSYLTARQAREPLLRRHQWITCLWWNAHRSRFEICVSARVMQEASAGDPAMARRRVELISPLPSLDVPDAAQRLAARILREASLPESAKTDAEHVAIAATYQIDFLLTWNCKHLANPKIAPKIVRACQRAGLRSPEICTPEVVLRRVVYERAASTRH